MAGKVSNRIKRAVYSSVLLFLLAGVLAGANIHFQNQDRATTVGPANAAQRQFFVEAVDRPDVAAFFKRLSHPQKLTAAQNLGRHDHPAMVRLAVLWLNDFDADARAELEKVLVHHARKYPKELAAELKSSGGFQKLAVSRALATSFEASLLFVIEQLEVPEARANASEYLALQGRRVGEAVAKKLKSETKETRLAAADVLGKIGFLPAAAPLRELYKTAESADRPAILSAIANMGDPASEEILTQVLADPKSAAGDRATAILGLGRIKTPTSIAVLWENVKFPTLRPRAIEALSLAGDGSLLPSKPMSDLLDVASGIQSPKADRIIAKALDDPTLAAEAAEFAEGRASVVPDLVRALHGLNPANDGRAIERLVASLSTTDAGRRALDNPDLAARFGGFIRRARLERAR